MSFAIGFFYVYSAVVIFGTYMLQGTESNRRTAGELLFALGLTGVIAYATYSLWDDSSLEARNLVAFVLGCYIVVLLATNVRVYLRQTSTYFSTALCATVVVTQLLVAGAASLLEFGG